nr:hypothetical protein [Klebsiella pneumoniae]
MGSCAAPSAKGDDKFITTGRIYSDVLRKERRGDYLPSKPYHVR